MIRRPKFLSRWLTYWGAFLYYGAWVVLVLVGEFLLQNVLAWWVLLIMYFVVSLAWTITVWSLPAPFTSEGPR